MFGTLNTYVLTEPLENLTHLKMYCDKRGVSKVASTNKNILIKLLAGMGNPKDKVSLDDYAGSLFEYQGIEIVFINPLKQLFTVSYGKFIAARFISKLLPNSGWREATDFLWELLSASNIEITYQRYKNAYAIAVDIETFKVNLAIRCCGFTAIFIDPNGRITTHSSVLPLDSEWAVIWCRKFLNLSAQKITQNGKYDNAYLLRYDMPMSNWLWDTAHFMHSWYSELPKDLAFLNAFFLRKVVYWKDLAETKDLYEYYRYNALDTWATANVWISQLLTAPDWAKKNYFLKFPLVFPCLLSELTGIQRDQDRLVSARKEADEKIESELRNLRTMVGSQSFNPNSPQQVKILLKVLGCADIESTEEKDLAKAAYRHPINKRIIDSILEIRGLRKLASTYLRTGDDAKSNGEGGAKEYRGTILYSINPHNTDTGRAASKESAFWCGFNIQNIPRGVEVKQTIKAPDGFYIGECDLEQAESRDTAHISGDTRLISAVTGERDFHSVNASAFFGIPYESIFDEATRKAIDKAIRDLAKRVNHGANYNMGPKVLVDTMGLENIWRAKRILNLLFDDPLDIAQYLLDCFHKTYPTLRGKYYPWVISEVSTKKMLVSRAFHHVDWNVKNRNAEDWIDEGDWTRYCFGNPGKNKSDLNALVAHPPQSLNARTLDEAYMKVFYEVALPNPECFRLHAQIHDSIFFSYRSGREDIAEKVRVCMEIPVTVRDVSGVSRTFTVPAAAKLGKTDKATGVFKSAKYWSETE